jgi:hypothetical protein
MCEWGAVAIGLDGRRDTLLLAVVFPHYSAACRLIFLLCRFTPSVPSDDRNAVCKPRERRGGVSNLTT